MPPTSIDATFRNGSLTAISVVVGFSLTFLHRWAALPGPWHRVDYLAIAAIVSGIAFQIGSLTRLLSVESLMIERYKSSIRLFLIGLMLVSAGVALAIVGDLAGHGQRVLGATAGSAALL